MINFKEGGNMRTILGQVVYPSMIQARPVIEIQLKEDISQYIIPSKLILTNKTKKSPLFQHDTIKISK